MKKNKLSHCNYCNTVTETKEGDCTICDLSKPTDTEPKTDLELKQYHNIWDHLDGFLKVYNRMKEGKWKWYKNTKCKYVDLRIDMRDGGCIIMDREGNRILPEDLEFQYGVEDE